MGKQGTPQNVRKLNFSLAEAAEALGVSPGFLRLEAQRGKLRTVRIGRRVLTPRAEVMQRADSTARLVVAEER
jgi:excisionase family DNA binding protein